MLQDLRTENRRVSGWGSSRIRGFHSVADAGNHAINGAPMGQSCWTTDDVVFGSGGDSGPVCFGQGNWVTRLCDMKLINLCKCPPEAEVVIGV